MFALFIYEYVNVAWMRVCVSVGLICDSCRLIVWLMESGLERADHANTGLTSSQDGKENNISLFSRFRLKHALHEKNKMKYRYIHTQCSHLS